MPLFDTRVLRDIASPEAFRRGKQYAEDGAVENVRLSRTQDGGVLARGEVFGGYAYQTSFVLSPDLSRVENYECDCPYSQAGACKHVVALGVVAARRSAVGGKAKKEPDADGGLLPALRAHARTHTMPDATANLSKIAGDLSRLRVTKGTASRPSDERRSHGLDGITISFRYDVSRDVIEAEATAHYGSASFPIEGYVPTDESDADVVARRDWQAEKQAAAALYHQGFRRTELAGQFVRSAEHAFYFLREGREALAETYTIVTDDAFDALAEVRHESAESDWAFRDGGEDWFSFSVDWKAAGRTLTAEEIRRLALGLDRYVRGKDGSFIEIGNADALRKFREATRDIEEDAKSKGRVALSRALELAMLAEETSGARIEETDRAVSAFLRDAREGKLLREPKLPAEFQAVLRPYQREAVAWALFLRRYGFGGVLADDMGLGKTLQTLAILSTERPTDAGPSLVVCPKSLVSVWLSEAAKFAPHLRVAAIDGTAAEREAVFRRARKHDLLVTSYSAFQRDVKRYRTLPLYYAVLDEAQYVKNAKTATASAVKTLRAAHRLALTGTPIENGVHELWSLFDFLMPGLLGDHPSFRVGFEKPIRDRGDVEVLARLKRRVRPFLLRRTKETVAPELPPRMEQVNWCVLGKAQAALYADVLASVRNDVFEAVERKGFKRAQIEILTALLRLRQVCNHPALVDKRVSRSEDESPKMAQALELIREAAEGGHKVLLFSQFTSMLDLLREGLDRMGIGHVTIEGKTKDRGAVVKRFREDAKASVFLLSLRAGGTGLTLTEADTVILFDPWWNPMVERQAMDRAHRIGQTKRVNVYKLATKGTVEEKVLALQEKKKAVFDAVVSESGEGFKGLTWEEVRGLFGEGSLSP